jgi:hypothetical protein
MKTANMLVAAGLAALFGAQGTIAQPGQARTPPEQLGKVHFATSCSPAVEKRFDRALALLHSFWAKDAIEGFNGVLRDRVLGDRHVHAAEPAHGSGA